MASAQQRALNPTATLSSSSRDPDEEEFPKTSSGILHEDVGKLPTTPSTGEQELPHGHQHTDIFLPLPVLQILENCMVGCSGNVHCVLLRASRF